MSGFWKVCSFLCTQYLVGPPFAWITASMRRGMEVISLWQCSGVIEAQVALIAAFRSSALLGLVSLIFLLTIDSLRGSGQASLLNNQAFQMNSKCTFIWKEDFGPLSNSPVIFLLSPGKMLLTMFLFQKWLGSSFPEDFWAWWLLMHWLQLQFTPCEALPSVWIGFAWQYSQACGHPCCLCTFSFSISSFQSTLHLICFDTALCEQSHLSVMTLCDLLSFNGLLDHCQVSSVPHYCVFKEQEIPRIYTVWMVIYWNSNVNILIFWDTDFWLSWAVSSNHQN